MFTLAAKDQKCPFLPGKVGVGTTWRGLVWVFKILAGNSESWGTL
jgi:hypothetical protein